MTQAPDVLERSVIQPGRSFITQGEENTRAYVIQNGEVSSFLRAEDEKILIGTYGPGTIIGELDLMVTTSSPLSYEANTTTTVITVTRQDFQKRLARSDKTIKTILDHAIKKLDNYQFKEKESALQRLNIDSKTKRVVDALIQSVAEEKKEAFKEDIIPHINGIINVLKKYNGNV